MRNRLLAAEWIVPVATKPIHRGAIVLEEDRVAWMGQLADVPHRLAGLPVELKGTVITPGLVNAHTHLQYTHFDSVGRGRYTSFEEWSDTFGDVYDAVVDPDSWRVAALDGAQRAIASGSTMFAEIVTNDEARGALAEYHAGGIEYLEAIGQFTSTWDRGERAHFLSRLDEPTSVLCGISPHAPYSLDGGVITDLVGIARQRGLRVHSHLGESSVEAELYRRGDHSVLSAYGDLRDEFELVRKGGSGHTTAGYADSVGLLGPWAHVAHAIYLERPDRDLLLKRGTQVALCPRSNAVIGLDAVPVAAYLNEGHEIAVGTDSLASSPSLDLMADVRELAHLARQQGYEGEDLHARLVRAATFGGATAMGLDGDGHGVLAEGGPADLAAFSIPLGEASVEKSLVEHGEGSCVLTMFAGRTIYER